jgi:hypothetical protein
MVEGGAEVEHNLAGHECPMGFDIGQLAQVEAVFKSAPVLFGPHGPAFMWRPQGFDLLLEYMQLSLCTSPLRDWPFKTPGHFPLPLR